MAGAGNGTGNGAGSGAGSDAGAVSRVRSRAYRRIGELAATRLAGVALACCAFATDLVSGWHGMNFAMRGLLDEPAHVATALVILGAIIRWRGSLVDPRFGWTMLACSWLIDLDHLPAEFGVDALTDGTPRPYTHALWVVILFTLAWSAARFLAVRSGRPRPAAAELILAGAAWGVGAHFVRDIATAPMSLWWPVTDMSAEVPYWCYVAILACCIAVPPHRLRLSRHDRPVQAAEIVAAEQ